MGARPNLHTVDTGQCVPFWFYDEAAPDTEPDMLLDLGREDIFHYIYGLLHSEDYRQRFRANLAKQLPRIPCVKSVEHYRAFRGAGQRYRQRRQPLRHRNRGRPTLPA